MVDNGMLHMSVFWQRLLMAFFDADFPARRFEK
jgi:hypothetical protein